MPYGRALVHKMGIPVALAAVLVIGTVAAFSQSGPRGFGGPGPGGEFHVQQLLGTLDLTSEQRAAIDKILAARSDPGEGNVRELMAAREALMNQIHAETFDEQAIRQAAAQVAAIEADHAVAQAKLMSEIRAVLTAEQRSRLQEALSRHERRMDRPGM